MKHNQHVDQHGSINILLIPLILAVLLLIGAVVFAFWAYSGRQDYKNNVDQKVSAAVASAKQQQSTQDNQAFAQAEKQPLRTYNGPESFGSLVIQYPKTWSAYVDDTGTGTALVDGYFYPGTVPAINGKNSVFALRVQVLSETYSSALQQYSSNQQAGTDTITPYSLPKVPSVVGVEISGQLQNGKSGTLVMLPLRSDTIEVWTEGSQFVNDFNAAILPNLTFSP